MSKQSVHLLACGYEPMRMKPVHFATGFFLSLLGKYHRLELLNKVSIIKASKGLQGDYAHNNLLESLCEQGIVNKGAGLPEMKLLRIQINGVMDNDEGVYPAYKPYSAFGNDYSLICDHLVTSQRRMDGYAGHFVHQILSRSEKGQRVLCFALKCISDYNSPIANFLKPLLNADNGAIEWSDPYQATFEDLGEERLRTIAELMDTQTTALALLCDNMQEDIPQHTRLRNLIIALCSWLFVYIQRLGTSCMPVLFMDFTAGVNPRVRSASRTSFTRQREHFFMSYQRLWDSKQLNCLEADFEAVAGTGFKFLEQHFSDLAIRIGYAQPRAAQARFKHFELQPDTVRILTMTVMKARELLELEEVATRLRDTWGICFGGCSDDFALLRQNGFMGIDLDEDLEPNVRGFVSLLKKMNLATEPSDGLVLCALEPEEML